MAVQLALFTSITDADGLLLEAASTAIGRLMGIQLIVMTKELDPLKKFALYAIETTPTLAMVDGDLLKWTMSNGKYTEYNK